MRAPTEIEKAYLAGIIDGEGSFIIYLKSGGKRPDRKFHRCMLSVANTDHDLILYMQDLLGGRIGQTQGALAHHRTVYRLVVEGRTLSDVTLSVLPYLRVKRRQADLVLEMLRTMTSSTGLPLPAGTRERREAIYAEYVEAKHGPARSWAGRRLA